MNTNHTKPKRSFSARPNKSSGESTSHKKSNYTRPFDEKKSSDDGYKKSASSSRGGYKGKSSEGGYKKSSSEGGYKGRSSEGGYKKSSSEGGYKGRSSEGGYKKSSSEGGYKGKSSSRSSYNGGGSKSGGRFASKGAGGNRRGGGGGRKQPSFNPSQFINKNPVELQEEVYTPVNTFETMGLDKKITSLLSSLGIITPSPIQDQSISVILEGNDLVGLAETGTGKTAAFLLPLIEQTRLNMKKETLILAPTRELALQIYEEFRKLSKDMRMFATVCVGGMNIQPQIKGLRRTNHFVIGTPGRVMDLIKRGSFKVENVTGVVLDEADRMLDMGFINDMRTILGKIPKERQTLFFSATMSTATEKLVHEFLVKPVMISVKKKDVTNSIEQDVVEYGHSNKFETLVGLLDDKSFERIIIFGSMKHSVERLSQELTAKKINAVSIHGNKSHSQRQRSLRAFKEGNARVLVATDVAARGIHVDDVTHVINYDLPQTFEDYVHRIGRTGRGEKKGKALTFISR
ncbi:MAG: ATP-dependent RNA helicase RhlE [Flavobacteriaceae bacterium]|jgi:ATP-dependent RNA helicase RhlE